MTDKRHSLVNRRRATRDEQKLERRQNILAVALDLFVQTSYQSITMNDVAEQAGLAKGTIYLYFKTKEELFLALQTQQLQSWFADIAARLQQLAESNPASEPIPAVVTAFSESLGSRPMLMRLLAIVHSILEQNIDLETLWAFKRFLLVGVQATGGLLERCFSFLAPGQGSQVLLQIYALVIGVQHLSDPAPIVRQILAEPEMQIFNLDFAHEFSIALRALLDGVAYQATRSNLCRPTD